ncbi:hypothetical protein YW5DRAFT_02557 [Streptomyces sp. Ncost-T6T-1]|nr:hypothetical protein [Streptomyces sp. Ncost-T6T-1]SBV04591.1 hypothetical protein YW5DRAFT_02557 [Streptomyces sp. Ncost-T6T-1]
MTVGQAATVPSGTDMPAPRARRLREAYERRTALGGLHLTPRFPLHTWS